MTSGVDLAGQSHQRASVLLRRWLAETHTPVSEGPLRLTVGPLRLGTDVLYRSPTGAHGFGAIHVLDEAGDPAAIADRRCWPRPARRTRGPARCPTRRSTPRRPARWWTGCCTRCRGTGSTRCR